MLRESEVPGLAGLVPASPAFLLALPSRGDHIGQLRRLWCPAKGPLQLIGICNQRGRIPRAARADLKRYLAARNFFHRADHFQDGMARARSHIESIGMAASQKGFERENMRLGKIDEVNVVANASAVPGVVVVSE